MLKVDAYDEVQGGWSNNEMGKAINEGFNLGVEMARKEFIEWLDDFRDKNENMIIEEVIRKKIMELKQSLEEK